MTPHALPPQQVHVMLGKAEERWWRALFKGGEERSYRELLREAVDADGGAVGQLQNAGGGTARWPSH